MSSSPTPFQIAQGVGNQAGKILKSRRENSALDEILTQAAASDDPQAIDQVMAKMLLNVPQEKQAFAFKILENKKQEILQGQQQKADVSLGFSPEFSKASPEARKAFIEKGKAQKGALTLNESLNQTEKRFKSKTANLTRPFEKKDSFGNIFLDFDQAGVDRTKVLNDLDEELNNHMRQVAAEYKKAGLNVPNDVVEALQNRFQVKVGKEKVNLETAKKLEAFSKKFPPSKHKGKTATDPESGRQIKSDGIKWVFVEEIQEGN